MLVRERKWKPCKSPQGSHPLARASRVPVPPASDSAEGCHCGRVVGEDEDNVRADASSHLRHRDGAAARVHDGVRASSALSSSLFVNLDASLMRCASRLLASTGLCAARAKQRCQDGARGGVRN